MGSLEAIYIMLQTITANLPEELQQRLHADFLADEQAYLTIRPHLLNKYRGQWVAIQGGKVIAASCTLMEVMDRAYAAGGHPYVALVGGEYDVVFRIRRDLFGNDHVSKV